MPAIHLTGFIGEQPKILPPNLPPTAAKAAVNVRLNDGGLTPIHRPIFDGNAGDPSHLSIYKFEGDWLSWAGIVDAAPGPVASDRLYYTGNAGVPKLLVSGVTYDLKMPAPAAALTATPSGSGSGDVFSRAYVYTLVSSLGEESEPSPASAIINWQSGQTVTLSAFGAVPTGRAITKQRIYRTQTGQVGTFFYLIAERAAGTGNFTDNIAVDAFQELLPSQDWNPPPDTLEGLIAMPNGMMAAFTGRDLYFAEPFHPHAWPEKYVLTTDVDIVAIGAIGTSIVVATKGNPYFVSGTHPSTMQMDKMQQNLPCINKRGLVDMGVAIAYPTNEGLVAVAGDGSSRMVTAQLFDRDSWQALSPSTMIGGQHQGRYVAFYSTVDAEENVLAGALFIDIGQAPYLIRSDAVASATYFDTESGGLYYLATGVDDIKRLDGPGAARASYYWRSKEFRLTSADNLGVILIDSTETLTGHEAEALADLLAAVLAANAALLASGPVGGYVDAEALNEFALNGDALAEIPTLEGYLTVGVYADGVKVAQVSRTGVPVRLKAGFMARTWEIDATGDVTISQIILAKTVEELMTVNG